ncbi:MAG: cytochrome C oxidase subunit IV family protein [Candidatus Omnitrophica bacterium]|nr:cytochrome C oxidase subunit IV family protein [bacterium]MCL4734579.1 cytochrome C oxidase subunit IV family protein [Candidatus Omnitrophota bacterium]NUP91980.1 cytochrome C oxidase subunit IV family protein [Candidatus Omnitrophota bacterium]
MAHESTPHEQVGHVMSFRVLLAVWIALMFLTYVTVAATTFNLGEFNLMLAMGIATLKASLVLLFFMHLVYDRPFNAVIFICSLCFVMLFVILAMVDTAHYQNTLIPGYAPAMAPE